MADAYNSTSTLSNDVMDVMNRKAEFAFRPRMIFGQLADGKTHDNGRDAPAGDVVKFPIYDQMTPAISALSETSDPDSVAISDSLASITLYEYGNTTTTTEKLRTLSTVGGVMESTVPTIVGGNMGESTDLIAKAAADSQTGADYVTYVGATSKVTIAADDILTAAQVRKARNKLEGANVPVDPRFGAYVFVAHPDVIYDLRTETGDAAWITLSKYADPDSALQGEVGMFDGFRFIQTTNASWEPDAGVAAQSATAADSGGNAAGSTTLDVDSGTGIVAGDNVTITHDASGNAYTYPVVSISTNEITIGAAFNLNGNPYRTATAGLVEAAVDDDVVVEGVDVYTSYAMGYQALGHARAIVPELRVTGPFDKLGRLLNVGWYGLHGYGEVRAEALHKVFSASSLANVS